MTTDSQPIVSPDHWTTSITPHGSVFHIPWRELWEYRDLIYRFVHRDFVSRYKQTVLGSLWYVLQPLFTSLMFTLVFNKIANISTGEIPPMLFFLAGTVCWSYFQSCVTQTASTFTANASIFDKVYFPRLAVPISLRWPRFSDHWPVKISDGFRGLIGCYRGRAFRSIPFWDWSPIFVSVA